MLFCDKQVGLLSFLESGDDLSLYFLAFFYKACSEYKPSPTICFANLFFLDFTLLRLVFSVISLIELLAIDVGALRLFNILMLFYEFLLPLPLPLPLPPPSLLLSLSNFLLFMIFYFFDYFCGLAGGPMTGG